MKLIKTKDGSFTLYNDKYQEHYHSTSGALEEAFEKHVIPLQIKDGMKILDFCFGLGYNSIAAIYAHSNLTITAIENDLKVLEQMSQINAPEKIKTLYNYFSDLHLQKKITDHRGNTIEMIIGDVEKEIKFLQDSSYDRVFFDPFSPRKQPELWSRIVFQELVRILKPGGCLSTYSCAGWIRRNMKEVGFAVSDGPIVGRRSPGTIAYKL
jgi:predicted methyltransferase